MKIDRVKVKNFKSLREVDLTLNNLTLLSGVNSSGKSSFIQTLLLLKQNQENISQLSTYNMIKSTESVNNNLIYSLKNNIEKIFLNIENEYVSLGNKKDILYQDVFDEFIAIEIFSKNNFLQTKYNDELKIDIKEENHSFFQLFNLFSSDFQYIRTDRISPQITYPLSEQNIKNNLIGLRGEYTAHYLAENKNKNLLIEELKHKESKTSQLLENTSLWLSEISENIDIDSTVNPSQNNVTLTYNYKYSKGTTNKFNPLNVGFGITYVLPIIVAILKSKPDDLIIIENPESHLHPAGQAKIAELCAIASSCGVQIIVETHSDHFLNGVRVATKKGILKPEDSSIYYFRKEKDELETKVDKINIDEYGNIDNYPKGFFDEWDNKLDELLGL
ncbi:MAG: DUF3696 domain-containing protein [Campylobacterota bacterium]|nr:DUF3696 domain-containing protein [Campylobacterota bacterium]